MEQFIESYGYLAVVIGTFIEGETIVILGGLAAKLGHLAYLGVILAAMLGTMTGDLLYFFLGRRYGNVILQKRPDWAPQVARVDAMIQRWDVWLVLCVRFLYGFRIVASVTFGLSSIDAKKYIVLNMISALLWTLIMTTLGYLLGRGAELVVGDAQVHGLALIKGVAVVGFCTWVLTIVLVRWRALRRGAAAAPIAD